MLAVLNPSTDSLTLVLAASAATTNPVYSLLWREHGAAEWTNPVGALTDDTAVTILSAPTTKRREVEAIDVYNRDTAACTVTLAKVVSGTSYTLARITLAAGDSLHIDGSGVATVNTAGNEPVSDSFAYGDAVDLGFGDSTDAIVRWSTGDASDHSLVVGLGDTSQMLHITDKAAVASDWAVTSPTHPTLYVHSNTTPTTDYLLIGTHSGTSANIDVVGGTTLFVKAAGNEIADFVQTASAVNGLKFLSAETGVAPKIGSNGTGAEADIGLGILDSNGNELVTLAATAAAVNEVTITNKATGVAPTIAATGGDTDINLSLVPKGAGFNISTGPFQVRSSTAVTATVGGGTTGLIPAGTHLAVVTSDNADKQISLPAASVGDEIWILVGATGCELISAVAAHKVNDVTVGATNEAALTATNLYWCKYVATNTWVVVGYTKLGAVQAALVPDSL